ncbi:MAG: hypothetical protein KDD40_03225 [Bdellovibrionales bacterium]|nr:hypothetical protein [Bdellovibrionales bacterium]
MRNVICEILEKCRFYPSGDNCQPFNFKIHDDSLEIIHVEDRAAHSFNPKNISSKLTLGFLLEAISIVASEYQLQYFVDIKENGVDATINFFPVKNLITDPLSPYVKNRITDRRLYDTELNWQHLKNLIYNNNALQPKNIYLLKNEQQTELKDYLIEADKIVWLWSQAFFDITKMIKFNEQSIVKLGLSPKNIGLKPSDVLATKIMVRFRPLYYILKTLGFLSVVSKNNTLKTLDHSPAFILITLRNKDLASTGRDIYRLWTLLCAQGYSLQPMSAAVLPPYCFFNGAGNDIPTKFQDFYAEHQWTLNKLFKVNKSQTPIFMFRVGRVNQSFPPENSISRLDLKDLAA